MKKFAFFSDFDGTLTSKDFYQIIIDNFLKDWGRSFYQEWKKTKKINVEFLNRIFGSINLNESELLNEIIKIPFDKSASEFIKLVALNKGDFYVVSAGTSYYIDILFKHLKIEDAKIISMKGEYFDGGIRITPDKNSKYYSEVFGIDKRKVLEDIKQKYEFVFFAGDSEPDLEAAKVADITFAKGELKELLQKGNAEFIPFETFTQISDYMTEKRWFNEVSDA